MGYINKMDMFNTHTVGRSALLASVAALALCAQAQAQAQQPAGPSTEAFYKGKSLNFVVGLAAGGGYDQYARTMESTTTTTSTPSTSTPHDAVDDRSTSTSPKHPKSHPPRIRSDAPEPSRYPLSRTAPAQRMGTE